MQVNICNEYIIIYMINIYENYIDTYDKLLVAADENLFQKVTASQNAH